MNVEISSDRVAAVRRFNRFYTRAIGVLDEKLLQSAFSLSETRVLYEIAHREAATAAEIARDLGLDPGYLSRMLRGFASRGLVRKTASSKDGRRTILSLTPAGRAAFAPLEERSQAEVGELLSSLAESDREKLVDAMGQIERLLGGGPEPKVPYILRPYQAGDIGWVIERHGALYAQEYGFDTTFEALVAEIAAQFLRTFDPARERCWIAERQGERVGSVFLVKADANVAKLRLLLVEPGARGLGIGRRLVEECVRFARERGYARITLWTNDVLQAARRIYERAGFRMMAAEPHTSFGRDLVGETWERELRP